MSQILHAMVNGKWLAGLIIRFSPVLAPPLFHVLNTVAIVNT